MANNEVRIISGKWRGRKLRFPNVAGLRPSMDRTRETLFNWLQGELPDAHCLDLFAGAGALGFEAASRGAVSVDMVDNNRVAFRSLELAKAQLKATEVSIFRRDAISFLQSTKKRYQIVFLDPPFSSDLAKVALAQLSNARDHMLTSDALVYLEIARKQSDVWSAAHWQVHRDKSMGESRCLLLKSGTPSQ